MNYEYVLEGDTRYKVPDFKKKKKSALTKVGAAVQKGVIGIESFHTKVLCSTAQRI